MWFKKEITKIIEVEKAKLQPIDDEIRDSIRSLQFHPGFQYLLGKLETQKAALKSVLVSAAHEDMRAVDRLQAGIFWLDYLAEELKKHTKAPIAAIREVSEEEAHEFQRVKQALDIL